MDVLTAESLISPSLWFRSRGLLHVSIVGFHRSCEETWWGKSDSGQKSKNYSHDKITLWFIFPSCLIFSTIFLIYFSFILFTCLAKSTVKTVSNPSLTEFELTRKFSSLSCLSRVTCSQNNIFLVILIKNQVSDILYIERRRQSDHLYLQGTV